MKCDVLGWWLHVKDVVEYGIVKNNYVGVENPSERAGAEGTLVAVPIIEFRLRTEELGVGDLVTVTPYIDHVSLVELARRVETGPAAENGEATLAGSYAGLVVGENRHDWTGWYNNDHPQRWFDDGDSCLLGCVCGDTGCWPLTARISLDDHQVTWSAFRTGHRSWDLAGLGPFTFDRADYDQALRHPTCG